jgi:hypothetical protein
VLPLIVLGIYIYIYICYLAERIKNNEKQNCLYIYTYINKYRINTGIVPVPAERTKQRPMKKH